MSEKTLQKGLSILIATIMIFSCFTVTGHMWWEVEPYETAKDLEWNFDKETKILTVRGTGLIPFSRDDWHRYGDKIEKVIICDGVTAIDTFAFAGLYNLKEVVLPETLECIYGGAFTWCFSLEKVNFPKSLKYILGEHAFGLTNLKNIVLPEGLIYCSGSAFFSSLFVEKIVVPESLVEDCESIAICSPFLKEVVNYSKTCYIWRSGDFTIYKDVDIDKKNASLEYLWCRLELEAEYKGTEFDNQAYIDGASEIFGIEFESYYELDDYLDSFEEDDFDTSHRYYAYCYENSIQEEFCKENNISYSYIDTYPGEDEVIEEIIVIDKATGVIAEYTSDLFDDTPEMVIVEGSKNANITFNGKFGKYTSFDISFEINGEKVQPNGMITIKIPLPTNYSHKSVIFFIDDNGNKVKLDSIYENGYISFETDHFSEYVIVDESSKIEVPVEPEIPDEPDTSSCSCNCHKNGFMGFIWKIILFFNKFFKTNKECACGITHY